MKRGAVSLSFCKMRPARYKASRAFIELQKRISQQEEQIADRWEFFNESVTLYNVGINEFPALILARPMNYPLLQVNSEETHYAGIAL
ncbi:hypothetical protein B4923_19580 [Brenneria roseae subsp. americana]|uniref:Uncharacterized protein n=1 Tax=Brenneria roseae subsp. americana TaxID=1508507 RepID=A0A2U1TJE6_9GAMM|nr:LemA family protein [Brenneria roseae]PWC09495.1 hypothetical protein B4923_19580 [Brenneria roseae subsp. americana]